MVDRVPDKFRSGCSERADSSNALWEEITTQVLLMVPPPAERVTPGRAKDPQPGRSRRHEGFGSARKHICLPTRTTLQRAVLGEVPGILGVMSECLERDETSHRAFVTPVAASCSVPNPEDTSSLSVLTFIRRSPIGMIRYQCRLALNLGLAGSATYTAYFRHLYLTYNSLPGDRVLQSPRN